MSVNPFRDAALVKSLGDSIRQEVQEGKVYRIMEVCGTHTMAIARFGIRSLLPKEVDLVSGPGCPVCVTAQNEIDAVFTLLEKHDVVITTFGDMLKVPGSKKKNLSDLKAAGADVRVVYSPLDTLKIAKETGKETVFIGIGFETTAPTVAALALMAEKTGAENVSILGLCKTMPEVIGLLLSDSNLSLDGFLCPGHVSAVTGNTLYEPIVEAGKAAVITGFEPVEMMQAILEIVRQVNDGKRDIANLYRRVVRDEGNARARDVMMQVFEKVDAVWRGIGVIPGSGLGFRPEYRKYDALARFGIELGDKVEISGCRCGDVLKGYIRPNVCPLFGNGCTPDEPVGPCMVSGEGSCSAYYKYRV